MFANCSCPPAAAITVIPAFTCGEEYGQIQKIIFQRRQTVNPFTALLPPDEKASWTPLFAAVANTKTTITPFFDSFVVPPSEAILDGGDDNTTVDGVAEVVGAGQIEVTGEFSALPAAILKALKKYNCEPNMTIYLVNEFGKIWGQSPDADPINLRGTPITGFFIGDGGVAGKNARSKTKFRFNFRYGWKDNLIAITPSDFDALNELP